MLKVDLKGCNENKKIYSKAIGIIQVRNDDSIEIRVVTIVGGKRLIYFECANDKIC